MTSVDCGFGIQVETGLLEAFAGFDGWNQQPAEPIHRMLIWEGTSYQVGRAKEA